MVALIPSLMPPYLTALTPEPTHGRMLGIILSGQFSGLLLSRSVSCWVAELWDWRLIYAFSAIVMLAIGLLFQTPAGRSSDQQSLVLEIATLTAQPLVPSPTSA